MRLRALALATAVGMVAALTLTGTALAHPGGHHGGHHGGRRLSATLWGVNETGSAGDPDGSGTASLTVNHGHGEVCFSIHVSGITLPASAASIFQGSGGASGVFVVPLSPPTTGGSSEGCVSGSRDTLKAMIWNPSAYYVNVFTSEFPSGALRGQLGKESGEGSTGDQTFSASLRGANEVPPGDLDGSGSASVSVSSALNQICYDMHVFHISLPATAAYIQQGSSGVNGPIVATLAAPNASGDSSGCVGLATGVAAAILANPSGYYVNVLTSEFTNGALRGQLGCGNDDENDRMAHDDGDEGGCWGDDD